MEPIGKPKNTYNSQPTGQLPACCPRCGAKLDHFLAGGQPDDVFVPSVPRLQQLTELAASGGSAPGRASVMDLPPEHYTGPRVGVTPIAAESRPFRHGLCIAIYMTGNDAQAHRRCLDSIYNSTGAVNIDLRVALGPVPQETLDYVKQRPGIARIYALHHDGKKYPALRTILYDNVQPITTDWMCWFDGDTYVKHAGWLQALSDAIEAAATRAVPVGMLGRLLFVPVRPGSSGDPRYWFYSSPWHRQKPMRDRAGHPAPSGEYIHFASGGFWCGRVLALRQAGIPDQRLRNVGDFVLGEQLWQTGYQVQSFDPDMSLVHVPPMPAVVDPASVIWATNDPSTFSGLR